MKHPHSIAHQEALQLAAERLNISSEQLHAWLINYPQASYRERLQLLHLVYKHGLDPLADEVTFVEESGQHHPFITIDGWARLINQHPAYSGMSLRDATELQDGIPVWMECCIYRNDRILPIVVKEYYEEVKTAHTVWVRMPRRMLRHRVIQQCARLAFGISTPDYHEMVGHIPPQDGAPHQSPAPPTTTHHTRTELLKQQLQQSINITANTLENSSPNPI